MERSKGISTPSSPSGGLFLRLAGALAFVLAAGFTAAYTTITYTFNTADQLTRVSSSQSGILASFTYDGDGQRITKTSAAGQTIYLRGVSGEILAEYTGTGQLIAEYVYLDGQRICKITHDAQGIERRVYYHADVVGTPVALTDEAGSAIARAEYEPFGEQVVPGAAPDPHKFTGKELDDESGLYYFGARYYDASLGRFISVDPVAGKNGDPQSWNRYAYAKNNPLRFIDLGGKETGSVTNSKEWGTSPNCPLPLKQELALWVGMAALPAAIAMADAAPAILTYLLMQGPQLTVTATEALNPNPEIGVTGTVGIGVTGTVGIGVTGTVGIGVTGKVGEDFLKGLGGESQVFFRTSQGTRFVDRLVRGIAHESKVGYTALTKDVAAQIAKDVELIGSHEIRGATWHFFESPVNGVGGPSAPLREALEQSGIKVVIH